MDTPPAVRTVKKPRTVVVLLQLETDASLIDLCNRLRATCLSATDRTTIVQIQSNVIDSAADKRALAGNKAKPRKKAARRPAKAKPPCW